MHIALDARMMGAKNTRGIGRYIEEIVRAVLEVDADIHYTLVVRELSASPFVGHPRVDHVAADIPWYSFQEQLSLSKTLTSIGAELIHVPHWNVPLALRAPFVVTVHDLLLLQQPASAKASTRGPLIRLIKHAAFRLVLRSALRRAKLIFSPTQFVKKDLERLGGVDPRKIVVTGEGITKFPEDDPSLCSTKPFLLYIGSAYPHKRLDLLLQAWNEIGSRYPNHELLIAGEVDAFMEKIKIEHERSRPPSVILNEVRRSEESLPPPTDRKGSFIPSNSIQDDEKAGQKIRFLGRVTDAQLAALYKRADAFVFPSSHEGFGLPPLEALSLGCPVVASDIPSLRETLPESGVAWFRDGDLHGMIRALETTLADVSGSKQAASSAQAWIRAHHDWKRSAKAVLEGYRASIEK